jgi:hypothetical protein
MDITGKQRIYFILTSESIAIHCTDRASVDVALTGVDKLGINANCRDYSKSALLQTHSVITVNSSIQAKDLMSRLNFEYECWFNLSSIYLNTNSKHIVSHLDDLNIGSHKISEVGCIIMEQEWKRLHTVSHDSYSVLVYVCFYLIGIRICNIQSV